MASYITITLDTAPPLLEIYSPRLTDNRMANEITIKSNEKIDGYELYILDSENNRRNYTFARISDNELRGVITFSNYPYGFATIYVRAIDDVGNISDIYSKSILIRDNVDGLSLHISDKTINVKMDDETMNIKDSHRTIKIDTDLDGGLF